MAPQLHRLSCTASEVIMVGTRARGPLEDRAHQPAAANSKVKLDVQKQQKEQNQPKQKKDFVTALAKKPVAFQSYSRSSCSKTVKMQIDVSCEAYDPILFFLARNTFTDA